MFDIFNPLATQQNTFSLAQSSLVAGYSSPIGAGVDWNTLTTRGLFRANAAGVNSPALNTWQPGFPGLLKVEISNDLLVQTYLSIGAKELLIRTCVLNGIFSPWKVLTAADKPSTLILTSETLAATDILKNFSKVTNRYGLSGMNEATGSFTAPFTGLYSYELSFTVVAAPATGYVDVGGFSQSFAPGMERISIYRTEFLDASAGQLQNFSAVVNSGSIRLSLGKITFLG